MAWMSPNMEMDTNTGGGIGKLFGRAFSGESLFRCTYTARQGEGMISFASSMPGRVLPIEISPQRSHCGAEVRLLATEAAVDMNIFFQKKLGSGFFGGEGFIMQRFSGSGWRFWKSAVLWWNMICRLARAIVVDTGYLAAMDETCSIDVQMVKGVKNMLFGGEGLFNTRITGPGHIWLQTMPASTLAGAILPFLPPSGN